jgi:hypothetical protein
MSVLAEGSAGNLAVDTAFAATASLPDWSQRRVGADFFKVDGYSAEHRRKRRKQKENKLTQGGGRGSREKREAGKCAKRTGAKAIAPPPLLKSKGHGLRRQTTYDFPTLLQAPLSRGWFAFANHDE